MQYLHLWNGNVMLRKGERENRNVCMCGGVLDLTNGGDR